ncbi:MAG: cytochrome c [Gemmatimonadaceae bacterium]|nr:cytochrome c [Gemmatimonadaceae bacterium]
MSESRSDAPTRERRAPRPLDAPEEARSLDRYYMVGLACMLLLIVAFPLYKLGEPARREATRESMHAENVALGRELFAQHCAACHGDEARGGRGFPTLGAREFGSAMVAYDLDLGGPFTAQEITRVVSYLRSLEDGAPSVPGWYKGALAPPRQVAVSRATERDSTSPAHDTARTTADVDSLPMVVTPSADVADAAMRDAERTFQSHCIACHGARGEGTAIGPAIRPLRADLASRPDSAYALISRGVSGTAMMAFARERGGVLEATTIRALVEYLRSPVR